MKIQYTMTEEYIRSATPGSVTNCLLAILLKDILKEDYLAIVLPLTLSIKKKGKTADEYETVYHEKMSEENRFIVKTFDTYGIHHQNIIDGATTPTEAERNKAKVFYEDTVQILIGRTIELDLPDEVLDLSKSKYIQHENTNT